MTKADEMFDAMSTFERMKSDMDDALMSAAGIDPSDYEHWPLSHITYDDYDNSFEFKGIKGEWTPTEEHLAACWALGFSRAWFCYAEGTMPKRIIDKDGERIEERPLEKYFNAPHLDRVFPGEPA